ncbi:ANTAR domain-containing protein [Humibacillus xanthopallidus]|uniref:ANTAR domain-containing protein n=1 Tax=Humibacillus xanthopallidus TaxID=412689 RepID=UPI001639B8B9|nr:ANTAR domain-containing protein [Humibacillus xanthopallidus]
MTRQQDADAQMAERVALLRNKVTNLELALEHSRDIGVAMGILMATEKVTRDCAFGMLSTISQNQNRKLYVVARQVIETGTMPVAEKPPA